MSSNDIGGLHFIEKFMNSEGCCSILKGNMMPLLKCLGRSVFQYDNDLKHSTKKKKQDVLKKQKVKILSWPSMLNKKT